MWDLLMLTCGWVAGVITTLAIRQAQDDERRPFDPALLPPPTIPLPVQGTKTPHQVGMLELSPYAPSKARAAQGRKTH